MMAEPAAEACSPLSGGYLLIVLAEPHSQEHKQILLQRLAKGLCSWDVSGTQIDIESELRNIAAQCPQGEELRNGEKLIQLASDSLVTEILIHPQLGTLKQCMRNLLASFSRHRHVIHAGYTLSGTGSWILQDGVYELSDMLDVVQEPEVQRLLRAYDSITVDLHCTEEGQWAADRFNQLSAIKSAKISLNPAERWSVDAGGSSSRRSALSSFIGYISDSLPSVTLDHLLEPSDVVGNIRFNHPTLYVFPGGQGDSALFGISGFNILVDGGFGRKPCFWDFTRHLDRLDAVVMTRNNASSLSGLTGAVCRKASSPVYPQVGHFFCNLPDTSDSAANTPQPISSSSDPLTIHLKELCRAMSSGLESLQLKAQPLYRTASHEPINLYHKVGHGTLDMYVISPSAESAEVKELVRLWQSQDSDAIASAVRSVKMGGKELRLPLLDVASVCALLVWHPADPNEQLTRLLFPGSAPQAKILEGLDKFKHLECLKTAVCMGKDMTTTPKSPTKTSKAHASSTSPRHSATPAATAAAAAASTTMTTAKKPTPVAKDNKESSRPAVKSIKATELSQQPSGSLTGGSRTGSGEIRVVKKTITSVAAKVAHKREPSKTRAPATTAENNATTTTAAGSESNNKMKKDAVNNLKAVEAKVHSFKSPAAMKRAAEEKQSSKKTADSAENAKEHAVVKDIKERAMRSQSQSREKRSASSVRSSVNDEEKKTKLAAASKNKANDAAQSASPAHKPKPKAKEATKEVAKPTASAKSKPIPSKLASSSTRPIAKESKPAAKSTSTPSSSSSAPSSKAVKRPVKAAAPLAAATVASVAAVAVTTAAVAVEALKSEDEPIVVLEEMVTAVEAAQAASSPSHGEHDLDAENAIDGETSVAVDESTILDAIESQIIDTSSEEVPVEADGQDGDDEEKQLAATELEAAEEEEIIGAAGNEEEENGEVVNRDAAVGEKDDNNETGDDSLEQIDHEREEGEGDEEEQQEDVQVETISASVAQEPEAIESEPVNVGDGLDQDEEEPSSLAFKDNDAEDQDTVSPAATDAVKAEEEEEEEDQCETEEEEMDIVLPNNEEEDQEEEQVGHEGIVLAMEEEEPTVVVMTSNASILMESQPQRISQAERDEDKFAASPGWNERKESISKESTTATASVQQSVIESIDSQVVHNVDEVVIEKPQTRATIEPMTVDVTDVMMVASSAIKQESERVLAKSPEIATLDSDKQSETLSSLSSVSTDPESNRTSLNVLATERSRSTSPADQSVSIVSDQESVQTCLNVVGTEKSRSSSRTSEAELMADKSISPVFDQKTAQSQLNAVVAERSRSTSPADKSVSPVSDRESAQSSLNIVATSERSRSTSPAEKSISPVFDPKSPPSQLNAAVTERSRSTSPTEKSVSPVFEREFAQTLNAVETEQSRSRSSSQTSEPEVHSEKPRQSVSDQKESAPTSLNVVTTERSRSTSPADRSISSVSDGESIASVNVATANVKEESRSGSRADDEEKQTTAAVMQDPLSSFSSVSTDQDSMTLLSDRPVSRPASANEQISSMATSKGLTMEPVETLSRPVSAVSEQSSSSRSGSRAADNNELGQEQLPVDECSFKQSAIGVVSAEKSWPAAASRYDDEDSMTSMGSVVVEEFKAEIIEKPIVVIAPDAPIRSPMASPAKTSSLATPSQLEKEEDVNDDDDGIEVEEETFQREIKAKVDAVPITPTERDAPATSGGAESLPHEEEEDETDKKEKKEEKAIDVTEEKKDDKLESKSKEEDRRREAEVTQQQHEPSERKESVQPAAVASLTSAPIDPRTLQQDDDDDDEDEVVEEVQVSKSDSKSQVEASPNNANKWGQVENEEVDANISLAFSDDYYKKMSPVPPLEAKKTSMMDEQAIQFSMSHDTQVASAEEDHRINIAPLTVTLESAPAGFTVPSPTFSRSTFVVPLTASTPIDGPEMSSANQMTSWSSKESSSPPLPSSPRDVSAQIEPKLSAKMEMDDQSWEGAAGTSSKVDQLITKKEVEVEEEESNKSPASPLFQHHSSYVKGPMGNVMYEDVPVPSLSVSVETNICSAIKPMSMADGNTPKLDQPIGKEQEEAKKKEDVCSASMIQPPLHASYVKGPLGNVIYVSPLEAEIKQEPILQSKSAPSPIPSQSPNPAESILMEKCDPLAAFPPTSTIDSLATVDKEPLKQLVIDTPLACKSVEEINQPKIQSELTASAVTDQHLKPESLSTSSSASATPKSPLSPNPSSNIQPKFPAEEQINKSFNEKLESASVVGLQSEPSSLGSEATLSSYSERVTDQEEDEDLTAPSTPNKTTSFLSGYEGVQIGASNKLSTIASSDGGQSCDSSIQHPSLDSNLSSRTYDKLATVHHLHQPEDTAFSSGPSSWDEREMMAARPSSSTYIAAESLSDRSATSSISHITDDEHQHDHGMYEKKEAKMADSSKQSISPVPSSPFSTTERDYEANKDSLSSVQTSASSDYQLGVESKVDDSASSARSDYSDRSEREELRASLTPRSDVSSSASETTVGQIIQQQQQPVVTSVITQQHQQQQQPVVVEVKASKAELADPKLAPHNIWLKEKGASSSPNPFSDDDAEASSAIYYQEQQHPINTAQQQHSDLDSDHQSDSQSMIHTDEYYAQQGHDGGMEASRIKADYDEAHGEAYLYDPEHDDDADQYDPYVAKYGDAYDDPYHHGEQQHGDHENGNSTYHHFYDSSHHLAAAYDDLNRNGNSEPARDVVVAAIDPLTPTRLDVSNSPQSTSPASISPQPPMQQQQQQQQQLSAAQLSQQHEETLASWGKPLGLPAPVAPVVITSNGNGLVDGKKSNGSPVKRATNATNGASKSAANGTNANATPFYVDLAYIPHHSDPKYCDVDFFRRVRARHYVLSTLEPSPQVLDALLEGKQSWSGDDKELDVTIIPTYDSDALALWVSANEELLAQNRIDLAPSASRCTINLQDHETSCSAYRLEF